MREKVPSSGRSNAYTDLEDSADAQDLLQAHENVQEFYRERWDIKETTLNFYQSRQWTDSERRHMTKRNKTPVVFNQFLEAGRTLQGLAIKHRYDVAAAPQEPTDQDLSAVINWRYTWEAHKMKFDQVDPQVLLLAWITGSANLEVYVEHVNHETPTLRCQIQNPLAIYWDPNSRDVGPRRDAQFVDRISWWTEKELQAKFPEKDIRGNMSSMSSSTTNGGYDKVNVSADRQHETQDYRNEEYRVVERFYVVEEMDHKAYFGKEKVGISSKELKNFRRKFPNAPVYSSLKKFLYVAIACEDWASSEYLYNGPASDQPRDAHTGDILWPFVEMPAEVLNGRDTGFVEHLLDPQRLINSTISNLYQSTKHSASTSYLIKTWMFRNEEEAKKAAKYRSDGDQTFVLSEEGNQTALTPIQPSVVSNDNHNLMSAATGSLEKISGMPAAIKGQLAGGEVSGKLNQQMIEQSFVQITALLNNFKDFLRRRAQVMMAYWLEYNEFFQNETVRIINPKPGDPQFVTLNQAVPEVDAAGQQTGGITFLNDMSQLKYDIVFKDSYQSPSMREKTLDSIEKVFQTNAIANNPLFQQNTAIWQGLMETVINVGDFDPKVKELFNQGFQQMEQMQQDQSQSQQQEAQAKNQIEGAKVQNDTRRVEIEAAKTQAMVEKMQADKGYKVANTRGKVLANQQALQDVADREAEVEAFATEGQYTGDPTWP